MSVLDGITVRLAVAAGVILLGGIVAGSIGGYTVATSRNSQKEVKTVQTADSGALSDEALIASVQKRFNGIGDVSISDSAVKGVKEVAIAKTGEVFYTDETGNYVFIGALLGKDNENLTKQRIDENNKRKFKAEYSSLIDRNIAIKIGSGKHEVIEFTDVDCPYCKQAETMFASPDIDATRYVYLTPIDTLHPEAAAKSVHILCSADPAAEYIKVMNGEVKEFESCEKGTTLLAKHKELGEKLNVQGTPHFFVNGTRISGLSPEIFEQIKKQ